MLHNYRNISGLEICLGHMFMHCSNYKCYLVKFNYRCVPLFPNAAATPAPYMVFASKDAIYQVNLDGTNFRAIENQSYSIAIDYDIRLENVYIPGRLL